MKRTVSGVGHGAKRGAECFGDRHLLPIGEAAEELSSNASQHGNLQLLVEARSGHAIVASPEPGLAGEMRNRFEGLLTKASEGIRREGSKRNPPFLTPGPGVGSFACFTAREEGT